MKKDQRGLPIVSLMIEKYYDKHNDEICEKEDLLAYVEKNSSFARTEMINLFVHLAKSIAMMIFTGQESKKL